jgi:large subunit ribosomal protein L6e
MVKKFEWYPGDDEQKRFARKKAAAPKKLRSGIAPGSVVILLAGRFRGKRVVALKQLKSGLLLVSGPYKINGVPLKRVNQRYVIPTSAKVDIKGVDVAKIEDDLFKREKTAKKSNKEKFFANDKLEKKAVSKPRLDAQKAVDTTLLKNIKADKDKIMGKYLNARFSLTAGQKPHEMKF